MEEKFDNPIRYQAVSEFNNEILVARRKSFNRNVSISGLISTIFFISTLYALSISVSSPPLVRIVLLVFAIHNICWCIYFFNKSERNIKNAHKTITYTFYENSIEIVKSNGDNNKSKLIVKCLYENASLRQDVAVNEFDAYLELSCRPKAGIRIIQFFPKNIISSEELNNLIQFLKLKLGNKYVTKTSE